MFLLEVRNICDRVGTLLTQQTWETQQAWLSRGAADYFVSSDTLFALYEDFRFLQRNIFYLGTTHTLVIKKSKYSMYVKASLLILLSSGL